MVSSLGVTIILTDKGIKTESPQHLYPSLLVRLTIINIYAS